MMNLEEYIDHHITPEDPVLHELFRQTHLRTVNPHQVSGHRLGSLLTLISQMMQPHYVLEIGTFTGYASICLARGLQDGGELHTIESNEELHEMALQYFNKAGVASKIKILHGNALDIIPTLPYQYDLVFIDSEKKDYLTCYQLVFDKVKAGGIILADNVLWYGQVADPSCQDATTRALRTFNLYVRNDPRVTVTILPLRDGLSIIRKNEE